MIPSFRDRLAVCSWSLQPATPQELIDAIKALGLSRVQLALDPLRENPAVWGQCGALMRQQGLALVSGMFGTVGEDYSSIEAIARTGGVVPDATWDQNWQNVQVIADIAHQLGLKLVTFHAGFLPHDETDPAFARLRQRIALIADLFAAKGIDLAFETGQETAVTLRLFLQKLGCPNVGVNFDPANMILYDKGDPIEALRVLAPWLKQCHIKDATRTKVPGTWGEEVAAGTGEVDWPAFFALLKEIGFTGHCSIEREAGNQRAVDIRAAKEMVARVAG